MPGTSWALGGNDGMGGSIWDLVKGLWQELRGPSHTDVPLPKDLQWRIEPNEASGKRNGLQIVLSQRIDFDEIQTLVRQIARQQAHSAQLRDGMQFWLTPWTHAYWASAAPMPRGDWDLRLNGHTRGGLHMLQTMVAQLPGEYIGAWSGWQPDSPALALYRHHGQIFLRELQTHEPMTMPASIQREGAATVVQLDAPLQEMHYRILPSGWLQPYFDGQAGSALMPLRNLLHERPSVP